MNIKCEHADDAENMLEKDAGEFWSESETNASIQDLSHWSGVGRWVDKRKWAAIGEDHLNRFLKFAKCENIKQYNHAVEWGPGGGSNAVAFLKLFKCYTGVDISGPNLQECVRQVNLRRLESFTPVLIDVEKPESIADIIKSKCDLFISTAVFQHFPSKEYGNRVLKSVYKILEPNASVIIQIRYDNGDPIYIPKKRDYKKNAVVFNSYRIDEFWCLMVNSGLEVITVKLFPENNIAYFFAINKTN